MFSAAGFKVESGILWLPCCPVRLITEFTRDMLSCWLWLDEFHQTPVSMGMRFEDVDPRYWPAMEVLKREQRRIEYEEFEKAREGGKGGS